MQWTQIRPSSFPVNARRIYIALNRRGEFYLNQGAMLKLGDPPAVKLMYDPVRKLIGIAPALAHTKDTFRLRAKDGDRYASRVFAAVAFCRAMGILPNRTIQFRDPGIEDGMLVLDTTITTHAPQLGTRKSRGTDSVTPDTPLEARDLS